MTHRRHRYRNDINQSKRQIIEKLLHWSLLVMMVFQQPKTTAAVKFKGDNCFTKNQAGVCKEWGECPIIKTLIESGEYTNREVVSCGFGVKEELICCPVRAETKSETSTDAGKDRSGDHAAITTTAAPTTGAAPKDFWLDLLQNTTSLTTAAPDFWLDLLKPTAATTTSSTTPRPLIIGDQKLNQSSEFFDFNVLLGRNQNAANQQRQTVLVQNQPNNRLNKQAGFNGNANERGPNLNTGPVNINQWSFDRTGNNFNNGRGINGQSQFVGNGHGNLNWGQQNLQRSFDDGRGAHRHFHSARDLHNDNGGTANIWGKANQNQGFAFPQNNIRPNNFFGEQDKTSSHPSPERNSNSATNNKRNGGQANNNSKNDEKEVDDLINYIFANSDFEHDDSDSNKAQNPFFNSPQPAVWLTPQNDPNNNHRVEFVHFPMVHHQLDSRNPQVPGQFEVMPVASRLINGNDLVEAPSANFIPQPVVIQTWPTQTVPSQTFNPEQVVYENLVGSGIDIVKAKENQLQPSPNHQPPQVAVVVQSQVPFQQHPQIIYQQQHFGGQMESAGKGPRAASQFAHQPDTDQPILNVQSPPRQILDPFKPFEFRPPPAEENTFSEDNNSLSVNSSTEPNLKASKDRPAVRACRRIEKGLPASLSPHILGGTPAELGEFPHMAAIGYSRIGGDDRPPYDIRCGGTLIDKRFVLTAAHCVSERENVPSIVRLGVVNFTDVRQMNAAVEIRIKRTFIHDEYRTRWTYNDIAVLELERDADYSEYIYPVCLYTDLKDPDTQIKLWVTGWGTVNTTTRSFSDILLKAPLHTAPLENCNKSFTDYGLNRRIPDGIIRSQFCAEDKDQIKDACQGDSGGPLNLIVDESYKNYRLVGVVSSGFGCASSTPGLYTRVAAFLDFIEKVVWPNGGD